MTHTDTRLNNATAIARPVLIAGVGYQFLRDLSVGPAVVELLQQLEWPPAVEIDDLSFGPIAIVQGLQGRSVAYERVILISAVQRGREPGRVYTYRWEGQLPDVDEIQDRIREALTGVISPDNLLVIMQYFGVLPADVRVIEVEPLDILWGPGFSDPVSAALSEVIDTARREALAAPHG